MPQEAEVLSRILDSQEPSASDPPNLARIKRALAADRWHPSCEAAAVKARGGRATEPVWDIDVEVL